MKPMLRWMMVALGCVSTAGCYYYPDYGYVRPDGYGTGIHHGASYVESYYGYGPYYGYGQYAPAYGHYGPYYWPGYYSIDIDVHHGRGHDGRGRGHDAPPAHRAGPEVQSRRRR